MRTKTIVLALGSLVLATTPATFGAAGPPPFVTGQPVPVIVQNPAANPAPATIVNPADIAKAMGIQHPYQTTFNCTAGGQTACDAPGFKSPVNQRLVFEYISGLCSLETGVRLTLINVQTIAGGAIATHNLPVINPAGVNRFGSADTAFGQAVRIYADPNTSIGVGGDLSNVSSSTACTFTLSGQAIDVP